MLGCHEAPTTTRCGCAARAPERGLARLRRTRCRPGWLVAPPVPSDGTTNRRRPVVASSGASSHRRAVRPRRAKRLNSAARRVPRIQQAVQLAAAPSAVHVQIDVERFADPTQGPNGESRVRDARASRSGCGSRALVARGRSGANPAGAGARARPFPIDRSIDGWCAIGAYRRPTADLSSDGITTAVSQLPPYWSRQMARARWQLGTDPAEWGLLDWFATPVGANGTTSAR